MTVAEEKRRSAKVRAREIVTHALLKAKLTDAKGKSLGRAVDLVNAIDEVMEEQSDVGGDRQFRIYVYLSRTRLTSSQRARNSFAIATTPLITKVFQSRTG
jgi:hypothetical protein